MFDKWDIALFKRFLKLAKSKGTGTITVVCGDKPNTWVVTIVEDRKVNEIQGRG